MPWSKGQDLVLQMATAGPTAVSFYFVSWDYDKAGCASLTSWWRDPRFGRGRGVAVAVDVGFEESPRFGVGDRVVAVESIGGFLGTRVAKRSRGIVIAVLSDHNVSVRFDLDVIEVVRPSQLALA